MNSDQADALTYCRHVLLPIWERWTDGDPSVRRVLDCNSRPDHASHVHMRTHVVATITMRMVQDTGPSTAAATTAGLRLPVFVIAARLA